ncbi:MAG UNVERIFIED_CONTAM: hypothetical protein LVR18_14360 [Planctomycetaceae bacterium]
MSSRKQPEPRLNTQAQTNAGIVSIPGLPDLDLSGPTSLAINHLGRPLNISIPDPDGLNIPLSFPTADAVHRFGGDIELGIDNFTRLSGTFAFEKQVDNGTLEILVAGTGIEAFLGANGDGLIGTSDDLGVKVTEATLGAAFYLASDGSVSYALDARGISEFVGLDGLDLQAELAVRVNTTGGEVNETITFPDDSTVQVVFAEDEAGPVFSGHVIAAAGDFARLEGFFAVSIAADRLNVAASGVTGFVGADDVGVSLTAGNLGLVIDTNTGKYALVAAGKITLDGIDGLNASGDASVRINSLGEALTETISTPEGDVLVEFTTADPVFNVSGFVSILIDDFVDARATVLVEKSTDGDLTVLTVQASDVRGFVGTGAATETTDDDRGILLSSGTLGLRLTKDTASDTSYYAVHASGQASIVGFTGLTLEGSLEAQRNTGPDDVTFDFGTSTEDDDLTVTAGVKRIGGTAKLAIDGFVEISGSFGLEKQGDTVLVGVAGFTSFLGVNGGTDDALGVQVSEGNLGLVLKAGSYALDASGAASLVGLAGLDLTGTFSIRANQLGEAVTETVWTPAGDVQVDFDTAEKVLSVGGSAVISVAGIFEVRGTISATKRESGAIFVDIPDVSASLNINDLEVFEIGGGCPLFNRRHRGLPTA